MTPVILLFQDIRLVQISLVFVAGFVAILFCATSDVMLLVGELLLGFPLGTINTIAPAYCLEVAPLALRHYGPTFINLCWAMGHVLGTGVLRAFVKDTTQWAWRIPYAIQVCYIPWPFVSIDCIMADIASRLYIVDMAGTTLHLREFRLILLPTGLELCLISSQHI